MTMPQYQRQGFGRFIIDFSEFTYESPHTRATRLVVTAFICCVFVSGYSVAATVSSSLFRVSACFSSLSSESMCSSTTLFQYAW